MYISSYYKYYKYKSYHLEEVMKACQWLLFNHPKAEQAKLYALDRINQDNLEKFQVGFWPEDENLEILTNIISKTKLEKLGLIYPYHVQNGDHRVYIDRGILSSHNLIMPYKDMYGNMVAFVGRTILPEEVRAAQSLQKYKYTPFTRSLHLFGLSQAKKNIFEKNSCILVEGQIDCLTCHEFGIKNVVALGGVSFTKYQFNLLRRITDNFILLLDSDAEGIKGSQRIMKKYSKLANFKSINLPSGYKDIDKCLRSNVEFANELMLPV